MSSNVTYKEFNSPLEVWKYFLKAEDGLTAQCKQCKSILKTSARSPKGLHVHMNAKHKIDTTQKKGPRVTSTTSSSAPSPPSTSAALCCSPAPRAEDDRAKKRKISDYFNSQDEVPREKRIARMVSKDGLPFRSFCTSQDLRELFESKGYKLPTSPNSIKLIVMNYGMTLKMKLSQDLKELKEDNHRFSLTFDEWTSTRNRRFMNVNIHTFSKGEALFWNLGLVRVVGSMPAESCIDLLKKRLSEYAISLDDDIAAITTDGASVMVKVGRLINPLQQLCYAHGLQLGIIDIIYKKKDKHSDDDPGNNLDTRQTTGQENEFFDLDEEMEDINETDGFDCVLPTVEVDIMPEFDDIIKKVRQTVKLFRHSPTKNDILQKYICDEFGKNLQLVLDCKTRWSSLADMISRFNKVKMCISKALIDCNLGTNPKYTFLEEEYVALSDLDHVFQPVKLAVEVLCRRESDLNTAETTLRFMVRKLENLQTPIAQKLAAAMRTRIRERRTIMTAALFYLRDPTKWGIPLECPTLRTCKNNYSI